jgi:hypothetical protein
MKQTLLILMAVVLVGCGTPLSYTIDWQHPDPSEKSIILEKSQTRDCWILNTITFPAGVYVSELKTETGVLYRAPKPLLLKALGTTNPLYGGIFIPNEKDVSQKHGVYWLPEPKSGQSGITRLRPNNLEFKYVD